MRNSVAKKIVHEVDDALEDGLHDLKTAVARLGGEADDALSHAASRLGAAGHALATEARARSKPMSYAAIREVKAHPLAAAAIAAAAAALIALAITRRPRRDA
jgi:ElaB/YqjD/DUF883 family membrane-anchored ribosome-binding protein